MELSNLRNYQQTPNKIMQNQGEKKPGTIRFILMSLFTSLLIWQDLYSKVWRKPKTEI